jgi:hypothetical protein
MTNRIEVKAKQAFYSDLTGARANGEIFQTDQEQAKANEAVSQAHHVQNMEANQHTESINQEAEQRAQNNAQSAGQSQADQRVAEQQATQHEPAATFNTKATAKKANDTK